MEWRSKREKTQHWELSFLTLAIGARIPFEFPFAKEIPASNNSLAIPWEEAISSNLNAWNWDIDTVSSLRHPQLLQRVEDHPPMDT